MTLQTPPTPRSSSPRCSAPTSWAWWRKEPGPRSPGPLLCRSLMRNPHHRSTGRRVGRCARGQEEAAAGDYRRVCNIHGGALLRRSRRRRAFPRAPDLLQLFLRRGREPDRRLPARAGVLAGHGPRLGLGLELRLPGRARRPGVVSLLHHRRTRQARAQTVPVTMLITAAFFAVAALPTFLFLRERAAAAAAHGKPVGARARDAAHARRSATCGASWSACCSTRPASPRWWRSPRSTPSRR